MKILFITPYDNNYRCRNAFTRSLSYMPLTMPYGGFLKLGVNIGFRIYNRKTAKKLRKEWKG